MTTQPPVLRPPPTRSPTYSPPTHPPIHPPTNPPTHPPTTQEPELFKTTKLCTEDNRKAAAEKLAKKQAYLGSIGRKK